MLDKQNRRNTYQVKFINIFVCTYLCICIYLHAYNSFRITHYENFFLLYAAFADTTSIILISMLISNRYVEQYMNTFDIFKEIYVRCAILLQDNQTSYFFHSKAWGYLVNTKDIHMYVHTYVFILRLMVLWNICVKRVFGAKSVLLFIVTK